jgi:hypothetical protein
VREQTPPLLKWLLVERATLAGNIERSKEREASLRQELERLQERQAQLARQVELLQARTAQLLPILADREKRLAALDSSIAAAYQNRVAPDAAGTVRAFAVEYRTRGSLKALLVKMLQDAAPGSLDTLTILQRTIDHFGLSFVTKAERQAFLTGTLRRQVLKLQNEGLVDALHQGKRGRVGAWRWKNSTPTLADLMAQMAARQGTFDALPHSL